MTTADLRQMIEDSEWSAIDDALGGRAEEILALWEAAQEHVDAEVAYARAQAAADIAVENYSGSHKLELTALEQAIARSFRARDALRAALAGMSKE